MVRMYDPSLYSALNKTEIDRYRDRRYRDIDR